METKQTNGLYDFGNFRLDAKNRLLYSADSGEQVALTLKEFEILLFFVRNHAQVIKRNDLLDAVWKDTFVEEGTLTRNISRLRKSLEAADTDGEKFIETLPKRGYRFLPRVVEADENDVLIVEEQTQMRVRIEETFDSETESANFDLAEENIEPVTPRALNPKPQVSTFKFLSLIFGATAIAAIAFYRLSKFLSPTRNKRHCGKQHQAVFRRDGQRKYSGVLARRQADRFRVGRRRRRRPRHIHSARRRGRTRAPDRFGIYRTISDVFARRLTDRFRSLVFGSRRSRFDSRARRSGTPRRASFFRFWQHFIRARRSNNRRH